MKELARGAEAVIFVEDGTRKNDRIRKHRYRKGYRIPEIDNELRKLRTRQEASILQKLEKSGFPSPKLLDSGPDTIVMQRLAGKQLKLVLDRQPGLGKQVGELVARLHDLGIVHADLTTSNMIVGRKGNVSLIDFGLGYHSDRIEDKAVDLHLFLQSLESKHFRVKDKAYTYFLEGYKACRDYQKVLKQLEIVERRGRHKAKC